MFTMVKCDDFQLFLRKVTVFHLVLLSTASVYTDANHGTLYNPFPTLITFIYFNCSPRKKTSFLWRIVVGDEK